MKKIFLSFSIVAAFAIFATLFRQNNSVSASGFLSTNAPTLNVGNLQKTKSPDPAPTSRATKPVSSPVSKPSSNPKTQAPSQVAPSQVAIATQSIGQYKNGTYTGSVADAYYGNIQVQAVISGGKLSDVVILQYPSDRNRSIAINTQAMPYLKSEAIQAQSANVNIISGASDSSSAFIQSLGDALAQAVN
jgi:uncharacterized protein with FMN-binding domain